MSVSLSIVNVKCQCHKNIFWLSRQIWTGILGTPDSWTQKIRMRVRLSIVRSRSIVMVECQGTTMTTNCGLPDVFGPEALAPGICVRELEVTRTVCCAVLRCDVSDSRFTVKGAGTQMFSDTGNSNVE